jgi:hypothetical protein
MEIELNRVSVNYSPYKSDIARAIRVKLIEIDK